MGIIDSNRIQFIVSSRNDVASRRSHDVFF